MVLAQVFSRGYSQDVGQGHSSPKTSVELEDLLLRWLIHMNAKLCSLLGADFCSLPCGVVEYPHNMAAGFSTVSDPRKSKVKAPVCFMMDP